MLVGKGVGLVPERRFVCAVPVAPAVVGVTWSREWGGLKRLWTGWGNFWHCYLITMVFPMYHEGVCIGIEGNHGLSWCLREN